MTLLLQVEQNLTNEAYLSKKQVYARTVEKDKRLEI